MTTRHSLTRNVRQAAGLAFRHLLEEAAAFLMVYLVLVLLASVVLVAGWAVMYFWPGLGGAPAPLYPAWLMLCFGHLAVLAVGLVFYAYAAMSPRRPLGRTPAPASPPAPEAALASGTATRAPEKSLPPVPPAPEERDAWL